MMIYNTFEEELRAIRLEIYEEVKDMTPEEEVAYLKAQVAPIHEQFGIHVIESDKLTEREAVLS